MTSDVLETYTYQHLDESKNEIRLVTILPGNYDDPLEITLKHVSLNPLPLQLPPTTLSLSQLEETMPPGWSVHETVEGRMLFEGPDRTTTWVHPCPHVKPTAYDITQQQIHEAEDTPAFEALSYTWGSFSRTATVTVYNGLAVDTKPSILPIGASLSEALRYLRLRDQERVVWIDALCINQDDLEERGHQVGRMAHIYSRARKVVAWLGPDFDDAVKALQGLKHIGEQVEIVTSRYFARSPGASEPKWYDTTEPVPFDDSFWAAVIKLIQRPWFSRYWVIQEIHIGSTRSFLKCGTHEIPWLLFRRAICCLSVKAVDFIARPHTARLNPMCGIVPGKNFEYLLSTLGANHHCSDSRDIIYGLLSLAPPQLQEALRIDYSADTQLVYKELFITYTSLQHRSDLLTYAGYQTTETDTTSQPWPSWVPDWRSGVPSLHGLLFSTASASGQSGSEMVFGAEPHNSMRIKGVLLDATISTLLIDDIENLADVLEKFTEIIGKKIPGETESESEKDQIKKVYKCIDVMHQGLTADRLVDPPLWAQSREQLRQDLFQNQDFSLESEESHPSWWFGYKSFIDFWWPGTKLFLTDQGRPGVCKWEVQSGMFIISKLSPHYSTSAGLTEVIRRGSLRASRVCFSHSYPSSKYWGKHLPSSRAGLP